MTCNIRVAKKITITSRSSGMVLATLNAKFSLIVKDSHSLHLLNAKFVVGGCH